MSTATISATGARSAVAMGDESNFGVPVDPTHEISGYTGESITAEEETIVSEAIRGDRGVHDIMRGQETVSGDINFEFSAEGLGKAIYHVLGDYVKAPDCDGGAHGRMETDSIKATPEDNSTDGEMYGDQTGSGTIRQTIPLAKDHVSGFDSSGKTGSGAGFAVVDRSGADNSLAFRNDGGAGWDFDEYSESSMTFVDSSDYEDTTALSESINGGVDNDGDNGGTADLATVTLYSVVDSEGNWTRPSVPSDGGYIEMGDNRTAYRVYASTDTTDSNGNPTKKLWIDPNDQDPSSISTGWANDQFVYSYACLVYNTSSASTSLDTTWPNTNNSLSPSKGAFVYEFDNTNYSGVYTHHLERGRKLPTGLTIEVDRDAAIFLYSGMKGTSLSLSFETNSVATGTATYTGHAEYAMATLEHDLLPDGKNVDNNMVVTGVEAFPDPKIIGGVAGSNSTDTSLHDDQDRDFTSYVSKGDYIVNLENNNIVEITGFSNGNQTNDVADTGGGLGFTGTGDERFAILPDQDLANISVEERTDIEYASKIAEGDYEDNNSANMPTLEDDETVLAGVKNVDRFHPKFSNVDCRTSRKVDSPAKGDLRPLTAFEVLVNINGFFEEVLSADVSIENNLNEDKFVLGSRRRAAMPAEGVDVTGTLSMEFDDGKNYIKFKNGDLFSVEFRLIQESEIVAGTNTSLISNTDVPPQGYVLLPKCKYTGNTPTVDDDSFIEHDMPFTAKVDDEYNMKTETVMILVNGMTDDIQ